MARSLAPWATAREIAHAAALDVIDAAAVAASSTTVGTLAAGTVTLTGPLAFGVTDSVKAKASGTHATGTPLTTQVNNVSTVATDADSVILPLMNAGEVVIIANSGTKAAQVFGYGTSTINGVATDTGVSLATGKTGVYTAVTANKIFGGPLG